MKVFVVIPDDSPSKNGMIVSVISAFADIESIGRANNLLEAVDLIRQRCPHALLFDGRILEEAKHDYLISTLEEKGSFILLPKDGQFRDTCVYIGIDFSSVEQKGWLLQEIGRTLREHRSSARK